MRADLLKKIGAFWTMSLLLDIENQQGKKAIFGVFNSRKRKPCRFLKKMRASLAMSLLLYITINLQDKGHFGCFQLPKRQFAQVFFEGKLGFLDPGPVA